MDYEIYNEDCLEGMKRLAENSVDCVGKGSMAMRVIISEDVSYIYKKCGLSIEETSRPRTIINTGNLYNCLNTKFNSAGHTSIGREIFQYSAGKIRRGGAP